MFSHILIFLKHRVKAWVELSASGYGTAPTPDCHWLIVAVPAFNKVAVLDLFTMKMARTIDVPSAPQEVLVRPDNRAAYLSCDASRKVAAINLSNWKVGRFIETGKGTDGLAWATSRQTDWDKKHQANCA